MKLKILVLLLLVISTTEVVAQNTFKAVVKDRKTNQAIKGATVIILSKGIGSSSDSKGLVTITNIPDGEQIVEFRFIGFETRKDTFKFPLNILQPLEIHLNKESDELDEIIVSSTRSSRTIKDIPTRIEFIAGEELEEKGNMKAGDIRMLLSESTGIQTQQTSATSGNASIRIQGLDGRYTQILKDGFPLFAGAASGLGLLQTPPLDLKQVEIIKGASSTLYGGGAIAGLVNLISKTPTSEKELRFHLNAISSKGYDLNSFYGERFNKIGITFFTAYNRNAAYAPANNVFTAIPKFERYIFNPKLFVYFNDKTKINFGINSTAENRIGGDLRYIQGNGDANHTYFEENKTQRHSTQLAVDHKINEQRSFHFKNSLTYFNRAINVPNYGFKGEQLATFNEVNFTTAKEKTEWVAGANLWTDEFREKPLAAFPVRNYKQTIVGAFAQNIWKTTPWLNLETGIRVDYIGNYGTALLPRISLLVKFNDKFSSRLGGGLGYKTPTIFTEESENMQYKNILAIDETINKLERSYGANIDFNYHTLLANKITFSINQLLFYTHLNNPLLLKEQANSSYQFINSAGYIYTQGTETNIKITYNEFKLFWGYTFTNTRLNQNGVSISKPLSPKHRVNSVLMYEMEDKWKVGLEAYYFSSQKLSDGNFGKPYTLCGFMAEKLLGNFSIYINFENFLDKRQTRFDTIYTGPTNNPVFRDIYAPLDGFLVNGGIKLKLR